MNNAIIPIRVANDIEQKRSWEGVSTPVDLAYYLAKILSVDASALSSLFEAIYKYPPNIPLLWTEGEAAIPAFMSKISAEQLADMGLNPVPEGKPYFWVIYKQ